MSVEARPHLHGRSSIRPGAAIGPEIRSVRAGRTKSSRIGFLLDRTRPGRDRSPTVTVSRATREPVDGGGAFG
ncbi:hypothetical protein [Halalkalicoccus salilacus]|uniref:hypothetical protein n=1 Tax=Halalkalicoccus sp. GCM10025704 TaxID=3252662 RepID=UPI0036226E1A